MLFQAISLQKPEEKKKPAEPLESLRRQDTQVPNTSKVAPPDVSKIKITNTEGSVAKIADFGGISATKFSQETSKNENPTHTVINEKELPPFVKASDIVSDTFSDFSVRSLYENYSKNPENFRFGCRENKDQKEIVQGNMHLISDINTETIKLQFEDNIKGVPKSLSDPKYFNNEPQSAYKNEDVQVPYAKEATELYNKFILENSQKVGGLSYEAFLSMYTAYRKGVEEKKINEGPFLATDLTQPSNMPRMYLFDFENENIIGAIKVAHGRGSGMEAPGSTSSEVWAYRTSNEGGATDGSNCTPQGLFELKREGHERFGRIYRLVGLEEGVNSNSADRNIYVHRARYVSPGDTSCGQSEGCSAVSEAEAQELGLRIGKVSEGLPGGTGYYVYHDPQTVKERALAGEIGVFGIPEQYAARIVGGADIATQYNPIPENIAASGIMAGILEKYPDAKVRTENGLHIMTLEFKLGDGKQKVELLVPQGETPVQGTTVIAHVHGDEKTAKKAMEEYLKDAGGAVGIRFVNNKRDIYYTEAGRKRQFDPNRIFGDVKKPAIAGFAKEYAELLSAFDPQSIVAVHNIRNPEGYMNYIGDGITAVHGNENPKNFYYVHSRDTANNIRNAHVEHGEIEPNMLVAEEDNSGGLSEWAKKNNIPYVNIETPHGRESEIRDQTIRIGFVVGALNEKPEFANVASVNPELEKPLPANEMPVGAGSFVLEKGSNVWNKLQEEVRRYSERPEGMSEREYNRRVNSIVANVMPTVTAGGNERWNPKKLRIGTGIGYDAKRLLEEIEKKRLPIKNGDSYEHQDKAMSQNRIEPSEADFGNFLNKKKSSWQIDEISARIVEENVEAKRDDEGKYGYSPTQSKEYGWWLNAAAYLPGKIWRKIPVNEVNILEGAVPSTGSGNLSDLRHLGITDGPGLESFFKAVGKMWNGSMDYLEGNVGNIDSETAKKIVEGTMGKPFDTLGSEYQKNALISIAKMRSMKAGGEVGAEYQNACVDFYANLLLEAKRQNPNLFDDMKTWAVLSGEMLAEGLGKEYSGVSIGIQNYYLDEISVGIGINPKIIGGIELENAMVFSLKMAQKIFELQGGDFEAKINLKAYGNLIYAPKSGEISTPFYYSGGQGFANVANMGAGVGFIPDALIELDARYKPHENFEIGIGAKVSGASMFYGDRLGEMLVTSLHKREGDGTEIASRVMEKVGGGSNAPVALYNITPKYSFESGGVEYGLRGVVGGRVYPFTISEAGFGITANYESIGGQSIELSLQAGLNTLGGSILNGNGNPYVKFGVTYNIGGNTQIKTGNTTQILPGGGRTFNPTLGATYTLDNRVKTFIENVRATQEVQKTEPEPQRVGQKPAMEPQIVEQKKPEPELVKQEAKKIEPQTFEQQVLDKALEEGSITILWDSSISMLAVPQRVANGLKNAANELGVDVPVKQVPNEDNYNQIDIIGALNGRNRVIVVGDMGGESEQFNPDYLGSAAQYAREKGKEIVLIKTPARNTKLSKEVADVINQNKDVIKYYEPEYDYVAGLREAYIEWGEKQIQSDAEIAFTAKKLNDLMQKIDNQKLSLKERQEAYSEFRSRALGEQRKKVQWDGHSTHTESTPIGSVETLMADDNKWRDMRSELNGKTAMNKQELDNFSKSELFREYKNELEPIGIKFEEYARAKEAFYNPILKNADGVRAQNKRNEDELVEKIQLIISGEGKPAIANTQTGYETVGVAKLRIELQKNVFNSEYGRINELMDKLKDGGPEHMEKADDFAKRETEIRKKAESLGLLGDGKIAPIKYSATNDYQRAKDAERDIDSLNSEIRSLITDIRIEMLGQK